MKTRGVLVALALSASWAARTEEIKWVAAEDGNAAVAANWSPSRVPTAGDTIVLDGTSVKAMTWDAGENGLPTTVAAWRQETGYTGTVTFPTTYPGAGGFEVFTVTGDVTLDGGIWTHPANDDREVYRLRVDVGGNVTVARGAAIDCSLKGYAAGKCHPGSRLGAHGGALDHAFVYGDLKEPVDLGSGGMGSDTYSGAGGGAVYLTVGGMVTLAKGNIKANAAGAAVANHRTDTKGGAGGSVFIRAEALTIESEVVKNVRFGQISANGSYCANNDGGAGGRIALVLTEQTDVSGFMDADLEQVKAQGLGALRNPGCGTVFVKTADATNGVLYLTDVLPDNAFCSRCVDAPSVAGGCSLPPGATWKLDGLVFGAGGAPSLAVPRGTTLELPNGWASVRTSSSKGYMTDEVIHARYCGGVSYQGGTLIVPPSVDGKHHFSLGWGFEALEPYMIEGDVEISKAARLGTLCHAATTESFPYSQITVNGNVDVKGGNGSVKRGWISTVAGGLGLANGAAFEAYGVHGGQTGAQQGLLAYGSVFAPKMPGAAGCGPWYGTHGAGALKLTVTGTLNVDGMIEAGAVQGFYNSNNPDGAGGSLDITCARLTGTGMIQANGNRDKDKESPQKPGGAAGRIAIRLTEPKATFATFGVTNIQAQGWHKGVATIEDVEQADYYVSAGTVYLQTAKKGEGTGTVYIRDLADADGVNTKSFTPFPSVGFGGEGEDFSLATLDVSSYARVKVSRDFAVRGLSVSDHATMDLNGHLVRMKKCRVNGELLVSGTYTAAQLAERGLPFKDTSDEMGGLLKITPDGMALIIR